MLFERIESERLAHYSYLVGDQREAVVFDPRRDCEVYVERAYREGMAIKHILETHRHEDYVIGSLELAQRTDAEIWHADSQLNYQYGQPVEDHQTWRVGRLEVRAIHSPGHTPGSMSYLLRDPDGEAWVVFTGDALFAGEVGRVDLLGKDRAEEMASQLYDTLFGKLLPLGDGVIVCPAHGAGSVCGTAIAERMWTTIGLERELNPRLQFASERGFVTSVAQELERPPYFRRMEEWNVEGPPVLGSLPLPRPLKPGEFSRKAEQALVVDTRMELGFASAHVPGSLSIWLGGLASFAGWFLPYDKPILLVSETENPEQATRFLLRLGYDDLAGYLAGGMLAWHTAGLESSSIHTVTVQQLCHLLDEGQETSILDVRGAEELETAGRIPGAQHIHVTLLPERTAEVPRDRTVYIFCGSGLRSMIAASLLRREGWDNLAVVLGGIAGWNSVTCALE
ncbi:MAG TPA: MBL fold metallo-hydrolase [Anaerolineae bacterium]|nr:MBL fold metallo-hydrolase [Anaerolineae bacterium]